MEQLYRFGQAEQGETRLALIFDVSVTGTRYKHKSAGLQTNKTHTKQDYVVESVLNGHTMYGSNFPIASTAANWPTTSRKVASMHLCPMCWVRMHKKAHAYLTDTQISTQIATCFPFYY